MTCPDCGAEDDGLHKVDCAAITRMMREQNARYRASDRYRCGWTDPRHMAGPTPPIKNWNPKATWLDRHGRQIGEWCREYGLWVMVAAMWLPILWKLVR